MSCLSWEQWNNSSVASEMSLMLISSEVFSAMRNIWWIMMAYVDCWTICAYLLDTLSCHDLFQLRLAFVVWRLVCDWLILDVFVLCLMFFPQWYKRAVWVRVTARSTFEVEDALLVHWSYPGPHSMVVVYLLEVSDIIGCFVQVNRLLLTYISKESYTHKLCDVFPIPTG